MLSTITIIVLLAALTCLGIWIYDRYFNAASRQSTVIKARPGQLLDQMISGIHGFEAEVEGYFNRTYHAAHLAEIEALKKAHAVEVAALKAALPTPPAGGNAQLKA